MASILKIIREKKSSHNSGKWDVRSMEHSLEKILGKLKLIPAEPTARVTSWLLIVLSVYYFADVTWKLIPDTSEKLTWRPVALGSKKPSHVDLDKIALDDFFGQYVEGKQNLSLASESDNFDDVPQTTLNIRLTGVISSDSPAKSLAIIESEGEQQIYVINDQVKGTPAKLVKIYPDRVIVSYSGKSEALMLDGVKYSKLKSSNKKKSTKKLKSSPSLREETIEKIRKKRSELLKNPSSIAEFVSIIPHKVGGELVGYRLLPRQDRELFLEMGLKPNDVAKSINGYDLSNNKQVLVLMKDIRTLQEFNLVVERDGQLISLSVNLTQN